MIDACTLAMRQDGGAMDEPAKAMPMSKQRVFVDVI